VTFIPCQHHNHLHDFSISLIRHAAIFVRQLLQASLICDAFIHFWPITDWQQLATTGKALDFRNDKRFILTHSAVVIRFRVPIVKP
jgi:hypothetical protein